MISHVFSLKLPLFPLHIWNNPCSSIIFLSKMLDFAKFPEDSIACCRGSDWPSGNLFSATRNPSNFQNSMIACRKVMHSRHKLYIYRMCTTCFFPGYCRRCFQLIILLFGWRKTDLEPQGRSWSWIHELSPTTGNRRFAGNGTQKGPTWSKAFIDKNIWKFKSDDRFWNSWLTWAEVAMFVAWNFHNEHFLKNKFSLTMYQRYINNTGLARADGMLTKGLEITLTEGLEITFARTSCSHL